MTPRVSPVPSRRRRGSVLIIVIWVCLGLVALTVYFADQMTSEMRAADGQAAEVVARQAAAASWSKRRFSEPARELPEKARMRGAEDIAARQAGLDDRASSTETARPCGQRSEAMDCPAGANADPTRGGWASSARPLNYPSSRVPALGAYGLPSRPGSIPPSPGISMRW